MLAPRDARAWPAGARFSSIDFSARSADAAYQGLRRNVAVQVRDADEPGIEILSQDCGDQLSEGASCVYGVRLRSEPWASGPTPGATIAAAPAATHPVATTVLVSAMDGYCRDGRTPDFSKPCKHDWQCGTGEHTHCSLARV